MEESVFTKIIKREIPAEIVYEDENVIAFLDAAPNNPGHTLVVPKTPSRNLFSMTEEEWATLMRAVWKVAHAVKDAVGAEGVNVNMNNEAAAGQSVFHAHIHVIPRYEGDGHRLFTPGKYAHDTERAEVGGKIRAALS